MPIGINDGTSDVDITCRRICEEFEADAVMVTLMRRDGVHVSTGVDMTTGQPIGDDMDTDIDDVVDRDRKS